MDRLVLHVGTMKSGTTFLQEQLYDHREALAAQGVLVPGESWRDQVHATLDVLGSEEQHPGAWERLLGMLEGPGTGVISMEFFASASAADATRVLATVPVPVHVVVTARDLNQQLPAMWQETLRNGATWRWGAYLAGAKASRPYGANGIRTPLETPTGRNFWNQQDLVRIVRTWHDAARGALTLITTPPRTSPPDELWRRFAGVVGFDPEGMEPGPRRNESMGAASAEVLRRTNEIFNEHGLPFPAGRRPRKERLAKKVLGKHRSAEPSIGLRAPGWVRKTSAAQIAALAAMDLDVVGDLAALEPVNVPGIDPDQVDAGAVAEAATHALVNWMMPNVAKGTAAQPKES